MRILLATRHPYIPQIAGGVQSNTHELAQELIGRGHEVALLCGLSGDGFMAFRNRVYMKVLGRKVVADHGLGYPVHRAWFAEEVLAEVCRKFRPDVVLCQTGWPVLLAAKCGDLGVPAVIYLHNVEDDDIGGNPRELRGVRYIANSEFTAERFRQQYGLESTVVPPYFDRRRYETQTNCERVVFINPHPHKGVHVALDVAELCTDIPFSFVEAWTLDDAWREELNSRLAWLPNVELLPHERDMRKVYGRARFLLVPSKWEEAWGRVATEAHFSGIPVIASRCGGLPEAVGPGGILIEHGAPASEWARAVRHLWSDEGHWQALSRAARAYSDRDVLNRDKQIDSIIAVLTKTVQERTSATKAIAAQ